MEDFTQVAQTDLRNRDYISSERLNGQVIRLLRSVDQTS